MKKFFVSIFLLFGILFTSCDLFPFFEEDELMALKTVGDVVKLIDSKKA